jgi:hypothetical protein
MRVFRFHRHRFAFTDTAEGLQAACTRCSFVWIQLRLLGEGNINLSNRKKHVRVLVAMNDLDVIERLHRLTGFGTVIVKRQPSKGARPQWMWRLGRFEHVQALVAAMWPFLGARRRLQCMRALRGLREMCRIDRRRSTLTEVERHQRRVEYQRRYRKSHRELYRLSAQRRRQRLAFNPQQGSLT